NSAVATSRILSPSCADSWRDGRPPRLRAAACSSDADRADATTPDIPQAPDVLPIFVKLVIEAPNATNAYHFRGWQDWQSRCNIIKIA
ncbi:MAG: hypothetical protein JOZ40_22630, partial [Methylobacteriaceae bacterium]|nr:hypothetical protein [Methylobacteriaceae bacterium]